MTHEVCLFDVGSEASHTPLELAARDRYQFERSHSTTAVVTELGT